MSRGRVARAAVLLYGGEQALTTMVPDWGAIVTTAPSAGSEGTVLLRREAARRRPLVLLIEDVLARLAGVSQTDAFRIGAVEVRLIDYEPDVVRELVANAFAHRDWEQPGMIDVAHSPDGLVVSSPGDLLPTLHPDRLLRESAQRNRVLSREITRLRIAEGAGMGFDRVYRSLAAAGKEPPQIQVGPRFTVVVPGGQGDRAFARFLSRTEAGWRPRRSIDSLHPSEAVVGHSDDACTTHSARRGIHRGSAEAHVHRRLGRADPIDGWSPPGLISIERKGGRRSPPRAQVPDRNHRHRRRQTLPPSEASQADR